jgi:endonuclease/exonuclease/phosphatase (EEP) superfamily protein YafD
MANRGNTCAALGRALVAVAALALGGCAVVPVEERLLMLAADGKVEAMSQPCHGPRKKVPALAGGSGDALDARALRVASWNIFKGGMEGWQAELERMAAEHDVLLLQEAVMNAPFREVLARAGLVWQMAGAFAMGDEERGVMIAARVPAVDGCTLRTYEPLALLPKSAMVAHFKLAGSERTVAMANLHGINFTLGLGSFREQLEAVATELARHDGPIVFAGDFNTWSEARNQVLTGIVVRLGLFPVTYEPDERRRAFGLPLDHFFVRGFKVGRAQAPVVKSSDHNPILVILETP